VNQQGDTPAVVCRGLRKVYDGRHGLFRKPSPAVVAVDGLDLRIERGECFGLLGPNGSGKTTTVEMLEGLLPPSAGDVELLGLRWRSDEEKLRERVGVALQETHLPEKLMVEELLTLFRSFYRKPRPLAHLLAEVELEEKQRAWVGKLSGGQRQRLAIACAMVGEPEVLFLDEPTTGLDPQSRRQVWGLVAAYRARGGTVVLTTHYMEEAERLCDRVAIVDHGKLVRRGHARRAHRGVAGRPHHRARNREDRRNSMPRSCAACPRSRKCTCRPRARGRWRCANPSTRSPRCWPWSSARAARWLVWARARPRLKMCSWRSREGICAMADSQNERDSPPNPIFQLTLMRLREIGREPGVCSGPSAFPCAVPGARASPFAHVGPSQSWSGPCRDFRRGPVRALTDAKVKVKALDGVAAEAELRAGRVNLLLAPPPAPGQPLVYRFDPSRAEARTARAAVNQILQRAAGQTEPRLVRDEEVHEPGSRYIDFLIPGLIAMNLMSGSMWGVAWVVVHMRVRKLLKRCWPRP
jgi:ABC-type multidrug transport system ATPase subunit